jgi:Fe-S-cluster-containing dehydrogenase component
MSKRCLVVNLDRCTGCDSCITACKYENQIPLGHFWNHVVTVVSGTFPDTKQYWLPVFCQQCENAACVAVCPTGASYRDEKTGVVLIDKVKCIGCKYCIYACPYGVRQFNDDDGVVEKCTLCNHLTATSDGVENPLDSADPAHAAPPCCHNCPTGARFYGDLDDPQSRASIELAKYDSESIHLLPDPGNANPSTRYILSPKYAVWKELI